MSSLLVSDSWLVCSVPCLLLNNTAWIWARKKIFQVGLIFSQSTGGFQLKIQDLVTEIGSFGFWRHLSLIFCLFSASGPIHTGQACVNLNANPLMLLDCSVDTPIHINRSYLLACKWPKMVRHFALWQSLKFHTSLPSIWIHAEIAKLENKLPLNTFKSNNSILFLQLVGTQCEYCACNKLRAQK